jgi:hypothetical protein
LIGGYGGMARLGSQTRPKKFSIFPIFRRDGDVNACGNLTRRVCNVNRYKYPALNFATINRHCATDNKIYLSFISHMANQFLGNLRRCRNPKIPRADDPAITSEGARQRFPASSKSTTAFLRRVMRTAAEPSRATTISLTRDLPRPESRLESCVQQNPRNRKTLEISPAPLLNRVISRPNGRLEKILLGVAHGEVNRCIAPIQMTALRGSQEQALGLAAQ